MSLLGDLNISGTATGRMVSTPVTQTLRVGDQRLFAASSNIGHAVHNFDLDKLEWLILTSIATSRRSVLATKKETRHARVVSDT